MAVPPRVPPRRRAPATRGAEPSAPQTAPAKPPTASSHWPNAKPIATATAAAATRATGARRSTPAAASPIAAPSPTRIPTVYQSPIRARSVVACVSAAQRSALGLQAVDHGERERGSSRPVDDAGVEGDADVADRPRDDRPFVDDRARADPVDAEDADLGVVDERGHKKAAELARARHGERRVA